MLQRMAVDEYQVHQENCRQQQLQQGMENDEQVGSGAMRGVFLYVWLKMRVRVCTWSLEDRFAIRDLVGDTSRALHKLKRTIHATIRVPCAFSRGFQCFPSRVE